LPAVQCAFECLTDAVGRFMRVAQLVCFIDDHQIPRHAAQIGFQPRGELVRHDQDLLAAQRIKTLAVAQLAQAGGIQDQAGQVEFFQQLLRPLLAQAGRADDQQAAFALGPVLPQHQCRFDGFAKTDLVGQDHALAERIPKRKQRSFDLVRIQIDTGVEQRLRQAIDPVSGMAQRQCMCVVFGVVGGEHQVSKWVGADPTFCWSAIAR